MIRNPVLTMLLVLALPGLAAPAAKELPASMTLEPDKTIRIYDTFLLGVNDSWPDLSGIRAVAGSPQLPGPEIAGRLRSPLLRMNGFDSQYLDWKKLPGRGLPGRLAAIRQWNPEAQYIWTVNMARGTPEDARSLAEFLTGDSDTLWGRVRIDLGFPEPMPPAIWELGDELDYNYSRFHSGAAYASECLRYIFAIRSVIPDARFAVHAVTAPWADRSKGKLPEFNRTLLDALAEEIDFLSFHPYLRDLPPAVAEPYFENLAREIAASRNPEIRLLVTEPALPPQGIAGKSPEHQLRSVSLAGCLEEAEWFLFLLSRPEVGAATLFQLPPGVRGMTGMTANGLPFETGLAQLYRFISRIPSGSRMVRSTLSGEAAVFNRSRTLSAAALKSPDGNKLYVLFDNQSPETDRPVSFRILRDRQWILENALRLSAPELASRNTATERPIVETSLPVSPGKPPEQLTIPAKSLVLVILTRPTKEESK